MYSIENFIFRFEEKKLCFESQSDLAATAGDVTNAHTQFEWHWMLTFIDILHKKCFNALNKSLQSHFISNVHVCEDIFNDTERFQLSPTLRVYVKNFKWLN